MFRHLCVFLREFQNSCLATLLKFLKLTKRCLKLLPYFQWSHTKQATDTHSHRHTHVRRKLCQFHCYCTNITGKCEQFTCAEFHLGDAGVPDGIMNCTPYTGCHRRNGPNFGRVFLMLKYTDITQNTYIQSWTVTEKMAREDWNFDSCYTLTDCQIHIETGGNMWFL